MDDSRSDVTPSIAELYKSAANPLRTDFNRVHVDDTPFVSSRGSRRSRQSGSQGSQRSQRTSRKQPKRRSAGSGWPGSSPPGPFGGRRRTRPDCMSRRSRPRRPGASMHPRIQSERTGRSRCSSRSTVRLGRHDQDVQDQDSLADIEFEHNASRQREQISAVNCMKDLLPVGATGIELANNKFKLLRLNRWSSDVTAEMDRYDRPLSKIYQRYWRKGSVSPFVELAVLLFGGLIFHHFKNVLFGVGGNQPPPQQAPPRAAAPTQGMPPPSRNVPFSMPQAPAATKRRTMRRPKRAGAAPPPSAPSASPAPAMPAPNLINMLLPKQQAVQLPPEGPQEHGAPNAAPPPFPVVVIDVQPKGRKTRLPEPTLEIIEEEQPASPHHVIDVKENSPPAADDGDTATVLSFDMA